MQQFGAFAFYTVVRWHKLSEVASEYTLHISIVLAICVLKIIKFGGDLTKFWQKQVGSFMAHPLYTPCFKKQSKLFLSQLCQIFTDFDNFRQRNSQEDKIM